MAHIWPKMPFLAIGGRGGPKWLAKVVQMVLHIGLHAGGLLWTQNASDKCTQRWKNGPKMAHFWPKMPLLAIGGWGGPKWLAHVVYVFHYVTFVRLSPPFSATGCLPFQGRMLMGSCRMYQFFMLLALSLIDDQCVRDH